MAGDMHGGGMLNRGHVWQGVHDRGHVWHRGMCDRGCMAGGMHGMGYRYTWQGVCMVGNMHDRRHAWQDGDMHRRGSCVAGVSVQERRPMKRPVLDCILVNLNSSMIYIFMEYFTVNFPIDSAS